ncbi:MAG: putative RNase H-like nuclease (RuvC/YqgF family) [Saprospiraceae bacterium]
MKYINYYNEYNSNDFKIFLFLSSILINMKKTTILFLLLTTYFNFLFAQVNEEVRSMTQGMNNALIINIPNADDKKVEKLWKKYMKTKDSKAKKIKKSEEWLCDNSNLSSIGGSENVDVYATFEQTGSDITMTAWFDMAGTYLSSTDHPERYAAGEDFLIEFEMEVYKAGVKEEVKKEENNMEKLESNLNKLKKKNERLHHEIEAAKKKIAKAEAGIVDNLQEQEETNTKIDAQKVIVEDTKKKMEVRENN